MDLLRSLSRGLGFLLVVPALAWPAPPAPPSEPASGPGSAVRPIEGSSPLYYVILGSPADYNALLQKIRHPDLEVREVGRLAPVGAERGPAGGRAAPPPIVESVRVRGQVGEDLASLRVELGIVTMSDDPVWVPIRLDGQHPLAAREGERELDLRTADRAQWQVELAGRGRHRVVVELRVPVTAQPARKALSLAIPEAATTSLELDFPRHESDILVGTNELFSPRDLPGGQGTRLSAHLWPRSRLDVSWSTAAGAPGQDPPLLTAQGEIAVDIDPEQMRTRSSWVIGCVRGMTRALEVRVDDQDEVTEVRLDDRGSEAGSAGLRGAGRLLIPLREPLRPGAEHRLVLKTRRSFPQAAIRRVALGGFPVLHALEQSGFIGITQGPNLWISPATSQGLRQIEPSKLPSELRARPSTSLAFEFLDQPFQLHLDVAAAPPVVRAQSRSVLRIDPDRAHTETTLELQWVGGPLFVVELVLGPGLQLVGIGPPEAVEGSTVTTESPPGGRADPDRPATRRLRIRLTQAARDQNKVTLRLEGQQRIPRAGHVELGLFALEEPTSVRAAFTLAGDRGLALELDDPSGQITRSSEVPVPVRSPLLERLVGPARAEPGPAPLELVSSGHPRALPIRITRHARSLARETLLSAQVSRRWVDLVQRTTFSVRHGILDSLEIRVPAAMGDRWELLDRVILNREELRQEPDGAKHYRLFFDRPVLDRATVRFRSRVPIAPDLDPAVPRNVEVPEISFPEVPGGPTRVELAIGPEIVFRGHGPGWVPSPDESQWERAGAAAGLAFHQDPNRQGRPFVFQALALEAVALPSLVVPRLLIKTVQGEETIRSRALYWVETHGRLFAFALPPSARWLAARVDGRVAEQVDFDPIRASYSLRLPADAGSKPVLVELEYQFSGSDAGPAWQAPRLLDGGIVLETLWEVRLPFEMTLVGVPRGWADENEWYWDGNLWKRRPGKHGAALTHWLLGTSAPNMLPGDLDDPSPDDAHHFLFSRTGPPAALAVWIIPRAWAVVTCSGTALIVGFCTIFSRIRFRTVWAVLAGLALLTAALVQPSAAFLAAQSAFIGVILTLLGLVIQRLHDRMKSPIRPGREPGAPAPQTVSDSSLNRSEAVGSDDSTAIRVRVPSTIDFVPAPVVGPALPEDAPSSILGRD